MKRLPAYLDATAPRLPDWSWALVGAGVHALLGLALLALAGNGLIRGLPWLRLEVAGLLLSGAVVAAMAWALARLNRRVLEGEAVVRQRLYEVIDCLPDAAAVRDTEGRYALWNHAAEAYYGIRGEHVIGKTPLDLFPEELARNLAEADRQAVAGRQPVAQKVRLPAIYGRQRRTGLLRVAPIMAADGSGELRGVVSILTDITEAEAQSDTLAREQARLTLAVQACGAGLWDWDLGQDKVAYSAGFEALLRYPGQRFRHDYRYRERLHPEDRDATLAAVHRSIDENRPFVREYRLLCFDGRYRRFIGRGQPLTDAWGQRRFIGLLTPVEEGPAA